MPLNCFGIHDWSEPFTDPFSESDVVLVQCLNCKMVQRYYPHNLEAEVNHDGSLDVIQVHQQNWNIRDKPFFDIDESKKGWAG